MSDGLIYDEEKSRQANSFASNTSKEYSNQQYGNFQSTQFQAPQPYYQAPYGVPNPQNGFFPPAPPYTPSNQSTYVVSPLQTPQPQAGQNSGNPLGYSIPQPQNGQFYQPGYSNNPQPQPQYDPNYQQFQHQQKQLNYGQPFQPQYSTPQQQVMYPPQPFYGASDEKQLVQPPTASPAPTQGYQQAVPYQLPPPYLGQEVVNVPFKPVTLHGDDQHHAVKAMLKAGSAALVIGAILGTYMQKKREKERQRLANSWSHSSTTHSTEQVAMYNHLMDKLENLSGNVLTEHRHSLNAAPWQEALHPHRRAVFADLYNSNENVRGFCSEFQGGPTAFPALDEYSLGVRRPLLSFQKANRQAPNWNVARELLSQVRTVILLDDSGSMMAPGHTSWGFQDQDEYNRHGIDIHFLNHRIPFLGLHSAQDVHYTFRSVRPGGGTPTGQRINEILDGYMCVLRYNRSILPLNLIVVTDGEAQDEPLLHRAIEEHVTKIVHRGFRAHQFGVEFLQVGDDEDATRHLEKLEEEVSRHHHAFQRDVVGVTPTTRQSAMTADKLLGIVLSGVDARMNGYMRHTGINV
ncbi:hypothetical protein EG329_012624 [Mollisiaceae sp. DMI_Dod_QoI]|nr:hypothetical protein EG329_012624 [Helotiales sp. DMI_Dod_QoI]